MATFGTQVRRGLPRRPSGDPWPPAGDAPVAELTVAPRENPTPIRPHGHLRSFGGATSIANTDFGPSVAQRGLRRGLPRIVGGDPWPATGFAVASTSNDVERPRTAEVAPSVPVVDVSSPLPFPRTVWPGVAARAFERERRVDGPVITKTESERVGPFTKLQWAGIVVVVGGGLLYAAAMAVLAVRWLLSTRWGVEFLAQFPGEYHLPAGAPVGFPAWLGWQHFFNVFLMVLIIRSGLQVRTEKRPTAFWSPRTNGKRKISLNLWFHQSLDILWIVNGVIFVVLLFVTGQWLRIVPTSWEVFPNAISAALQYVSLDWPTDNGWVNYNALQQLAYFTTVFVAAPLALITGVRMSGIWPKNAKSLSRIYPVEWARAVHFPVMLYFVLFIFVHVVLVFATGALRNLNHMYAAQGSVDPNAYGDNWAGLWIFSASILVIVGGWVAARPLTLASIARLFGNVGRN
ncbi:cytochrome b/b6 domain-containing protein [Microbacterium rhizomatis]|uniref:Cytochrome b/b6 domain-containing protein n=1 Tax=Microbacterium rhizomatis TaxID=1631477 RepID=A0A5J5J0K0_9MICO|nr:cytochrome b/b6 domain-containing protein [Microbacterium rhizomatis]